MQGLKAQIRKQSVSADGAAVFNDIRDETLKAACPEIRNMPQTYASDGIIFQLHCDRYDRLTDRLTASDTGFFTSKVAFINFHNATETIPARAHHRPS